MLRNCGIPRTHHLDHVMLSPRASDNSHTERPTTAWNVQVIKVAQRDGTARISGTSCNRTEAAIQRSHDYIGIIFSHDFLKPIDFHDIVKVLYITIVVLV